MAAMMLIGSLTFVLAVILVLSFRRSLETNHLARCSPGWYRSTQQLAIALREVAPRSGCRKFLVANAPPKIMSSFGIQQQRLACFSLQVAASTLCRYLTDPSARSSSTSIATFTQNWLDRMRCAFLFAACTLGRTGLGILRAMTWAVPPPLQLWTSERIVTSVGTLLEDFRLDGGRESGRGKDAKEICGEACAFVGELDEGFVVRGVRDALAVALPNDLSRMMYIATLRDNNSGNYYHPELVRKFGVDRANSAMLACHNDLFDQVVALDLEDLTNQLDIYADSTRVSKARMIETWKKLRAYRATIPMDAPPISAEIFFMKLEVALSLLEARLPFRIQ